MIPWRTKHSADVELWNERMRREELMMKRRTGDVENDANDYGHDSKEGGILKSAKHGSNRVLCNKTQLIDA